MKHKKLSISLISLWLIFNLSYLESQISDATKACLDCHSVVTPGIVSDWKRSLHSQITPAEALKKNGLSRKVSSSNIPPNLANVVVGCAECHTLNPESHKDTFDHNDFKVHIVVTPNDCSTCHPLEASQYQKNLMSQAHTNLMSNPIYHNLMEFTLGPQIFEKGNLIYEKPATESQNDACLSCHGTKVEVKGTTARETQLGEMNFPVLSGWPNNGVGRINPDGSSGSCASCHPRHSFSISIARKPYTCGQCHKGPDVPAYKVYMVSKHGNIFSSSYHTWNFDAVPWTIGKDFQTPTCATCHASLLVDEMGNVVAERTHQMNDRSAWRIFGLIYAHPHPNTSNTTIIKNKAGLPLPTELTGEPVEEFLISKDEMNQRREKMKNICLSCHANSWIEGFFAKFEKSIEETNKQTLAATLLLLEAWNKGVAKGLPSSIFDEAIEKMWVEQWLFYANSVRFASAMGGADYGVFAEGRWYLNKNLQKMKNWLKFSLPKK